MASPREWCVCFRYCLTISTFPSLCYYPSFIKKKSLFYYPHFIGQIIEDKRNNLFQVISLVPVQLVLNPGLSEPLCTSRCVCAQSCLTLWPHGLVSMGFSKQEHWFGLPFPPPGDLPNPEIKPALTSGFFITEPPHYNHLFVLNIVFSLNLHTSYMFLFSAYAINFFSLIHLEFIYYSFSAKQL